MKIPGTLPCIICHGKLENPPEIKNGNQPNGGLEFIAAGHWPSTIIDIFDGRTLRINICDSCLLNAAENNLVAIQDERNENAPLEIWAGMEKTKKGGDE